MNLKLFTTVHISKCKLGPFEYAQTISKWPMGSVYIGSIVKYLPYLPTLFPKGLEVDLEGTNC